MPRRLSLWGESLLIFAYAAFLIWPVSQTRYLDAWWSIESTFISDGRFLAEHWPRPLWQPNWYNGTRFNYIYPPALRYGTAAIARAYPAAPAKAYHLYISFFFAFGITGVYLLVRLWTESRVAALLSALGTAWLSPAHVLVKELRDDTADYIPQRLKALIWYGEGPHISSLAVLPFAIITGYYALRHRSLAALGGSALFCALLVSNNFYGATALAMTYPFLVWAVAVTTKDRGVWVRAAAIPVLAMGLCAWWLGPSYIQATLLNLRLVANPGNPWSVWLALSLILAYAAVTLKWARGKVALAWPVFLIGAFGYFSLDVMGNHYFQFRIAGEPTRLFPEWDMLMVLTGVLALGTLWRRGRAAQVVCGLLLAASLFPVKAYIFHPWRSFHKFPEYKERIEYKLSDWIAKNLPQWRMVASGSMRFWYNAWHDLPQLGGGSEQGVTNQRVVIAQWRILQEPEADLSILWAQAMGVDGLIVHYQNSQELYHDWVNPHRFEGKLDVMHDTGQGDRIYRIPRRYTGLARVVDRARVKSLPPMNFEGNNDTVRDYVALVEQGPEAPTSTRWEGTEILHVDATVGDGQSVVVMESYDPYWRAYVDGKAVPVAADVMGQMIVDAPAGTRQIRMVFDLPDDERFGRWITLLSLAMVVFLVARGVRRVA